ncbi:hypothetical protein FHG87_015815 [Trinorchestia longiramus]|nr:hypothetical protein FHG87_015815 [Trinorchestia longiramus]
MLSVNPILLVCCAFVVQFHESSSFTLSIFGGGVLVGLGRAIYNATKGNNNERPVLVRPPSAVEPEVTPDYLEDYVPGTLAEYNYDYEPIDLNYSYDYDTETDSGQLPANASESDAGIIDVKLNPEEVNFRDQPIPDFSDPRGGRDPSLAVVAQPDNDYNVALDDAIRQDETAFSTSDGLTAKPDSVDQEIDTKDQHNLTVPDYSSNPSSNVGESPTISFQEIFSGIISFTTEEPQPIYESIISNDVFTQSDIENPEYVPDLESEDTFNPKYGLGNVEAVSVLSPVNQINTATTTVKLTTPILPTSTTPPKPPAKQSVLPPSTTVERAKLLARYRIYTSLSGQSETHFVVQNGKSLRASGSKYSEGALPKRDSNSPALGHQASPLHLFRGKSSKNIVSLTACNKNSSVVTLGSQKKAELTSPESSIAVLRPNPSSTVHQRPMLKPLISSLRTNQKFTDGSPNSNVKQTITPRVGTLSRRTHQKSTYRTPSSTVLQRSMPRASIVSHRTQQNSRNGSQIRNAERTLISRAPIELQKIQQKLSDRPLRDAPRKSSQSQGKGTAMNQQTKNVSGQKPSNIRSKRNITERKVSKSKKLVDGYLPRGVGIDLRHRDRLHSGTLGKKNVKSKRASRRQIS